MSYKPFGLFQHFYKSINLKKVMGKEIEIEIRKAHKKDSRAILKLVNSSENLMGARNIGWNLEDIKDYFSHSLIKIFVVQYKNKIIGCSISHFYKRYVYLFSIIIDKRFRHRGIGKRLHDYTEKESKRKGKNLIEVDVENNNKIMKKFLQNLNYKQGNKFVYLYKKL
jgi:ribosomal protein S18 acetylase RimI-like enzyme